MLVFIPSSEEQFAIEAKVSRLVGPEVFGTSFVGFEVAAVYDDVLVVWAQDPDSIEERYSDQVALIAQGVLIWPLRHLCGATRPKAAVDV
jgi:hypothetical protein